MGRRARSTGREESDSQADGDEIHRDAVGTCSSFSQHRLLAQGCSRHLPSCLPELLPWEMQHGSRLCQLPQPVKPPKSRGIPSRARWSLLRASWLGSPCHGAGTELISRETLMEKDRERPVAGKTSRAVPEAGR